MIGSRGFAYAYAARLAAFVTLLLHVTPVTAAPIILSSSADTSAGTLHISGSGLAPGVATVLLGPYPQLAVTFQTTTQIIATLPTPATSIPAGAYALYVQIGTKANNSDESLVTIGAIGPTGAPGPAGPAGPQGPQGPQGVPGPAASCSPGDFLYCYNAPMATIGVAGCKAGTRICDATGAFGSCVGAVLPAQEVANGLDDDCDGVVDNGVAINACLPTNPCTSPGPGYCDGTDLIRPISPGICTPTDTFSGRFTCDYTAIEVIHDGCLTPLQTSIEKAKVNKRQ
jgi:hypothetical protein